MKKQLLKMYSNEKMGSNSLCLKCRSESDINTNALTAWIVNNINVKKPIVFIGKVARGDGIGVKVHKNLEDVIGLKDVIDMFRDKKWAYWSYTREIIIKLFKNFEEGLKNISFLNMIKCNNRTRKDTTNKLVKDFCINQNRFIWKELKILNPFKIVFYTSWDYDNYIENYTPNSSLKIKDIYDKNYIISIGNKTMPWWEREFIDNNGTAICKFLRIGHPERKKKDEFIKMVSKWLE